MWGQVQRSDGPTDRTGQAAQEQAAGALSRMLLAGNGN